MIAAYLNKYYPKYQEKLLAQDKMTYQEALEDSRANPVPMIMETNPKDFFDEQGVLVKNFFLDKTGKNLPVAAPTPAATAAPEGE